ncbi:hypothetical protein H312_03412 [Anncaliia algerae PRA339]|uniref:Uncharacterized protein n=1 Tax=Anncaliia algerae PRA339 TaxID=1288291 RepID=A0A059EWV4_9MICR|nr:hypothetical protein H312_03412 [Anncaliia algerae PRA339]
MLFKPFHHNLYHSIFAPFSQGNCSAFNINKEQPIKIFQYLYFKTHNLFKRSCLSFAYDKLKWSQYPLMNIYALKYSGNVCHIHDSHISSLRFFFFAPITTC